MSAVIDLLMRQHQDVLARIDQVQGRFGEPEVAGGFLDFLEGDVMAHFQTEEDLLFPRLAEIASIAAGPLRVMDAEHTAFRDLLRAGQAARGCGDHQRVAATVADLAALLQSHIAKEDGVLFPMALHALTEEQMRSMDAAGATTL